MTCSRFGARKLIRWSWLQVKLKPWEFIKEANPDQEELKTSAGAGWILASWLTRKGDSKTQGLLSVGGPGIVTAMNFKCNYFILEKRNLLKHHHSKKTNYFIYNLQCEISLQSTNNWEFHLNWNVYSTQIQLINTSNARVKLWHVINILLE